MHPKRAVLYSRVSTMMQSDFGVSLEMQEDMARRHCEREGWEFAGLYTDTMSGTKDTRPQLALLEAAAGKRQFDVVLVYKMDRLARSLLKLLQVAADFADKDIGLVSLTEPIDFTTPMGKALLAMLGAFAEMEAQNIATRVRDSMRLVAARGGRTGAHQRALGYQWDEKLGKMVAIPEEVDLVRAIFRTYLAERTYRATAAALNAQLLTTINGKPFAASSVRNVIRSPLYVGTLAYGRTAKRKTSKGAVRYTQQPQEKWITVTEAHEPLIDQETWERCQAIATGNLGEHPRRMRAKADNPWSGLIECGGCGSWLNRYSTGGKKNRAGEPRPSKGYDCRALRLKSYYVCATPAAVSDAYINQVVMPAIASALEAVTGKRPKSKRAKPAAPPSASAEIDALKLKAEKAWEMYVEGRWSREKAQAIEVAAAERIEQLTRPAAAESPAELPRLENFLAVWESANDAVRGDILRLYVERAHADAEAFTVYFHEATGIAEPLKVPRVSMRGWYGRSLTGKARPW